MILEIPNKVGWEKDISSHSLTHYGKTNSKRIEKTHAEHMKNGICYEFVTLTTELLDWFTPIYNKKISEKNSPVIFDLYETTKNSSKDYMMLVISEKGTRLGSVIFAVKQNSLSIIYKVFTDNWLFSTLPANPSLYADYLITLYGQENSKSTISHGKDRNGYGKTSSIGLATFKIALGYKPCLPNKFVENTIDTSSVICDSLYFANKTGTYYLQGYLFTTLENRLNYSRLEGYKDKIHIEWVRI